MPKAKASAVAPFTPPSTPPCGLWGPAFFKALERGDTDIALLKGTTGIEVKEVAGEARTLDFVVSSQNPDRDRDIVHQDGLDFGPYLANPVVLWAHDHSIPALGHAINVSRAGNYTLVRDTFAATPFADSVYQLLVGQHLRAVSIGGMPSNWTYDEERRGYDILGMEVWEHSICNVPANRDALRRAKASGIDVAPVEDWCLDMLAGLKGEGLWLERAAAEVILKSLGNGRGLTLFQLPAPKLAEELGQEAAGDAPVAEPPAAEQSTPAEIIEPEKGAQARCDSCGGYVSSDDTECSACGHALKTAATPPLTAAQVVDLVRVTLAAERATAPTPPAKAASLFDFIPESELAAAVAAELQATVSERFLARFGVLLD